MSSLSFSFILLLSFLSYSIHAQNSGVIVAQWKPNLLPFANVTDSDQFNWSGIEVDITNTICPMLGGCTFITVDTLDERLTVIADGVANMSIGAIVVTPERQEIVKFIKPYYYSVGATLYATSASADKIMANGGWDGLSGKPVCVLDNYYYDITAYYPVAPITVESNEEGVSKAQNGECIAWLYDSGYSEATIGLNHVPGLDSQEVAPYGIAVSKTSSPELHHSLSAAIIRLMQDGPESDMVQWDSEYVYSADTTYNKNLNQTVDAISTFDTRVLITNPLNATPTNVLPGKVKATPALVISAQALHEALLPADVAKAAASSSANFTWPVDWKGFEIDIINRLCTTTLDCAPPILLGDIMDNIDARIDIIQKQGKTDNVFVISSVSVTEERAQRVSYIHPYYYSSGPALFTTPAVIQTLGGEGISLWEGLTGKPVCIVEEYYAAQEIQESIRPQFVYIPTIKLTQSEALEKIESGECVGYIWDADVANVLPGLVALTGTDNDAKFVSPYGIIMAKDGDPNLYAAISAGLVDMMDDGDDSEMLKYEEAVIKNGNLLTMVNALSNFSITTNITATSSQGGGDGDGGGDLSSPPPASPSSGAMKKMKIIDMTYMYGTTVVFSLFSLFF